MNLNPCAAAPFVYIAYHPESGYSWGDIGRWDAPPHIGDGWEWHLFVRKDDSASIHPLRHERAALLDTATEPGLSARDTGADAAGHTE